MQFNIGESPAMENHVNVTVSPPQPPRPAQAGQQHPWDAGNPLGMTPSPGGRQNIIGTPLSGHLKLLNGRPLTPGSELRGREIPRTPPEALTPGMTIGYVRPGLTPQLASKLEFQLSPSPRPVQRNDNREEWATTQQRFPGDKRVKSRTPIERKRPFVSDTNIIPSGKQLCRTPPQVAPTLSEAMGPSDHQPVPESTNTPKNNLENQLHKGNDYSDKPLPTAHKMREKLVTPEALVCPENLTCTENDQIFLQRREKIHKVKTLEKKVSTIMKRVAELQHRRELLEAEGHKVKSDVSQMSKEINQLEQDVRGAVDGHISTTPSHLPLESKVKVLTNIIQKDAAQVKRLESKLMLEIEKRNQMNVSLDVTAQLEEEKAGLQSEVHDDLPRRLESDKAHLVCLTNHLAKLKANKSTTSCDEDQHRSTSQADRESKRLKKRLEILYDRVKMARQRKEIMQKMLRY